MIVDEAAAIRAGRTEYGECVVPVDPAQLTPAQREELLACPVCDTPERCRNPYRDDEHDARLALPAIPDASMASVAAILDARPAARAAAEAEAAERAAREVALREWAQAEGSEHLRWMIGVGVGDWQSVAREEWVAAHAPILPDTTVMNERTWADAGTRDAPPLRPKLHELVTLAEMRKMADSTPTLSNPRLVWVERDNGYCLLVVDLTAPDGSVHTVAARL